MHAWLLGRQYASACRPLKCCARWLSRFHIVVVKSIVDNACVCKSTMAIGHSTCFLQGLRLSCVTSYSLRWGIECITNVRAIGGG